ncbi:MAG: NAD(P)-dependent oxidoreductase, partial [Thermaerobacterales bacterium]
VEYVRFNPREPIPEEHEDAEVLVIWGNPPDLQKDAARRLRNLRCVQSLNAGVKDHFSAGFPEDVPICNGRGLHTITVAEHTLALLLAAARRIHEMRDAQPHHRWPGHLSKGQPIRPKDDFRGVDHANIVIWGMGSIGQRLGHILKVMGANVQGIATRAGERNGIPVAGPEDIDRILPTAHALVMILPDTPETLNALSAERLALLPRHAWVVNVGRGANIDEAALAEALRDHTIAGAALDVFQTEPLPEDSPLWDLDNVIISPHAAGGRALGAADLIQRQVENLLNGQPLENQVDPNKGY